MSLNQRLFTGPECQGMCPRGATVAAAVGSPIGRIMGGDGAPSENTRHMMDRAREAADTIESELASIMAGGIADYRAELQAAGYTPFGSGR